MRRTIISIHLWLAAFAAPAFILVAVSGGLYLLDVKGSVESTPVILPVGATLDFSASDLSSEVERLLDSVNIEHDYDYLKQRSNLIQTRPTSKTYLEFSLEQGQLTVTKNVPDLQASMMELHKGHGPSLFKTYQKLIALSLLFVVLSGLWLGLSSPGLRKKSITAAGIGLGLFVLLIVI